MGLVILIEGSSGSGLRLNTKQPVYDPMHVWNPRSIKCERENVGIRKKYSTNDFPQRLNPSGRCPFP